GSTQQWTTNGGEEFHVLCGAAIKRDFQRVFHAFDLQAAFLSRVARKPDEADPDDEPGCGCYGLAGLRAIVLTRSRDCEAGHREHPAYRGAKIALAGDGIIMVTKPRLSTCQCAEA